jgi:transcription termination factor Rho
MSKNDIYISQAQLRRFQLRNGDLVFGKIRPPRESEKHYGLIYVESVNGIPAEESRGRTKFEDLTPIFPDERINLETKKSVLSNRLINLIAPIGRGQRAMIVSPPKAGKTTILKDIANAISENYEDINLIISLIGERPEEVTDMDRSVQGEVVASTSSANARKRLPTWTAPCRGKWSHPHLTNLLARTCVLPRSR